tara:strand:- start:5768 stop:6076 length:309 start_codon:yes stop_codon:yes gene_type:complete
MSYYNTNGLLPQEKRNANKTIGRQEYKILSLFRSNTSDGFTPDEILRISGLKCPITSIRRAFSDLTKKGFLEKTTRMRMGMYGKPVHVWKLPTKVNENMELF